MGKNKMENFIFTALVCFFMIFGMSSYNSILKHGFNSSIISGVLIPFVPIYCIALAIDWFFVGPLAKNFAGKLTNENTIFIKKILLISFFMVTGGASDCITTSFKELTFSSSLIEPKSLSAFKFSIFCLISIEQFGLISSASSVSFKEKSRNNWELNDSKYLSELFTIVFY